MNTDYYFMSGCFIDDNGKKYEYFSKLMAFSEDISPIDAYLKMLKSLDAPPENIYVENFNLVKSV